MRSDPCIGKPAVSASPMKLVPHGAPPFAPRMSFKTFPLVAAACLWFAQAAGLQAAPRIAGPVRYDFANDKTQVVLSAELINHNSRENATGTLQLQLWATKTPYAAGVPGWLLGSTKLEGLAPGQFYKNFRKTVPYSAPKADGSYFITMVLLEYRSNRYAVAHSVPFDNKASLGPPPLFTMTGPWNIRTSVEGGTVEMEVAKIKHRRTAHTGSLKLSAWLTAAPYRGGTLRGIEIGSVRKEPLQPGYEYSNVKNVAKYARPPGGTYYFNLVLMESDGDEFKVVAWLTSATPSHFAAPQ